MIKNTDKSGKNIKIHKDIKICIEHIASHSLSLYIVSAFNSEIKIIQAQCGALNCQRGTARTSPGVLHFLR